MPPKQIDMFRDIRQVLIHHSSACHTCGASTDGRNSQAWASLHVKRNPGHHCEVSLGYSVRDHGGIADGKTAEE